MSILNLSVRMGRGTAESVPKVTVQLAKSLIMRLSNSEALSAGQHSTLVSCNCRNETSIMEITFIHQYSGDSPKRRRLARACETCRARKVGFRVIHCRETNADMVLRNDVSILAR